MLQRLRGNYQRCYKLAGPYLLALALALMISCGGSSGTGEVEGTAPPNESESVRGYRFIYFFGEVSLEERIAGADVIARVRLRSVSSGAEFLDTNNDGASEHVGYLEHRFDALEYLQGSGGAELVAVVYEFDDHGTRDKAVAAGAALLSGRDTQWDGRDAIVFLKDGFATRTRYRLGSVIIKHGRDGDHYSIASRDFKTWLPASSSSGGASETSGGSQQFLLDVPAAAAGGASGQSGSAPTITLAQIKEKIASIEQEVVAGGGSAAYRECLYEKYRVERNARYSKENKGGIYRRFDLAAGSGLPAGTQVYKADYADHYLRTRGDTQPPNFGEWHLLGRDAALFAAKWPGVSETARPLPAGDYKFYFDLRPQVLIICYDLLEDEIKQAHEVFVTVTAPTGTTHEAFFDPVTLTAGGVGANSTEGALKPAAFTVGSQSVELESLAWSSSSAVLTLDTHVSLSGKALDAIALDGTGAVTLAVADATVDQANATWTWSVAAAPWKNGDKLMLRLRDATAAAPPTPAPTPTPTPEPAVECMLGSGVQTLPWAVSHTALTECTIGYANARRIYYFQADQSGYITVANTTPQGDAYLRLKEAAGFGQNRANLTARIPVGQSAGANVTAGQWYALMLLGTADGQTITGSVSGSNGLTSIR